MSQQTEVMRGWQVLHSEQGAGEARKQAIQCLPLFRKEGSADLQCLVC